MKQQHTKIEFKNQNKCNFVHIGIQETNTKKESAFLWLNFFLPSQQEKKAKQQAIKAIRCVDMRNHINAKKNPWNINNIFFAEYVEYKKGKGSKSSEDALVAINV